MTLINFYFFCSSHKSGLLEPLAVAKEGNKPAPHAPAPGQQVRARLDDLLQKCNL